MDNREIKPKRHLYLHKPPPKRKRYSEAVGGISLLIFLGILFLRLIASLWN
jgi:hypothetical protein